MFKFKFKITTILKLYSNFAINLTFKLKFYDLLSVQLSAEEPKYYPLCLCLGFCSMYMDNISFISFSSWIENSAHDVMLGIHRLVVLKFIWAIATRSMYLNSRAQTIIVVHSTSINIHSYLLIQISFGQRSMETTTTCTQQMQIPNDATIMTSTPLMLATQMMITFPLHLVLIYQL